MSGGDAALRELLLGEYQALKSEQQARIVARDHLMYATLAALGATAVAVLGMADRAAPVLLLPPVCIVLGWTYLVNDQKISAIGGYLRGTLIPRLAVAAGTGSAEIFGWERAHRSGGGRTRDKAFQLAVDLIMFVLPAVLAVALAWAPGPPPPALIAASAAELTATGLLGHRIVRSADLRPEGAP